MFSVFCYKFEYKFSSLKVFFKLAMLSSHSYSLKYQTLERSRYGCLLFNVSPNITQ